MSDSQGPKCKSIPSWQRQGLSTPPDRPDNTPPHEQAEQEPSPEPRSSLNARASEFLKDESLQNSPIERKKLFLESKGLTEAEIGNLLKIHNIPEAAVNEEDPDRERPEVSQQSTPLTPLQEPQPSPPLEDQPAATTPRDPPPIITYPEFLLHAQKPSPLITASRLLTSLYLATGTLATIYGTSTYILEPMLHNLTSARHSLFSTTNTNIETLNKKLEGAVSKVPPLSSRREEEPENDDEGDEEEDADSTISVDGARFFQRSAGTQTSPRRLSRSSSSSIIIAADPPTAAAEAQQSPAQEHTSALSGLHGKLSDLLPTTNGEPRNPLRDSIGELRAYLEKLPYANSGQLGGGKKVGRKGEAVDAVAKVKAEIRGVKGVLLSARNFPSGVAAR